MKELFGTLHQLIGYVEQTPGKLLFRGQPSAQFGILPSVGRPHRRYKPNRSIEKNLFDQFRLKSRAYKLNDVNQLESLIVARHYGLRTRLLDWTENLYVALYFAIEQRDESSVFPLSIYIAKSPPIVPYFSLPGDPFSVKGTVFFEPPHLDQRIANQNAYLSLHGSPFVEFSAQYVERFSLFPYPQAIESIRKKLLAIGIRHSTILPGLDGLSRDINDNPSTLEQELLFNQEQSGAWTRIPEGWIGRRIEETKRLLIEERLLLEFLKCYQNSGIIGIPLEIENGRDLRLFAYSENSREVWLHYPNTHKITKHQMDHPFLRTLRVPSDIIQAFFPNGELLVIRKSKAK